MTAAQLAAFNRFWLIYPRKIRKGLARRAWLNARKKATEQEIITGLANYQFHSNPLLQPHPSTWLNQERWADEDTVDPNDRWGLHTWYQGRRDPGWTEEGYADILELLLVPERWAPDLDILGRWALDGYKHSSVVEVLREARKHNTEPVRYLQFYDAIVRRRAFHWDASKLEYVRGS